jgi:putative ABC transport system permease protein
MYTPFPQTPWPFLSIAVRTRGDAAALGGPLRAAIVKLDPDQPVAEVRTVTEYVAGMLTIPRFLTTMVGGFATFSLVLAGCGLFSVMAYSVAQNRREIGIRMALGAQPADVRRVVIVQAARLGALGLVLGFAGAFAAGRQLGELAAGITATDPLTYAGVCATLLTALVAAAYLPARRATRVNPVAALRAE